MAEYVKSNAKFNVLYALKTWYKNVLFCFYRSQSVWHGNYLLRNLQCEVNGRALITPRACLIISRFF